MAVLPWSHNRTRTDSSGEKPRNATLDWFSRSTAEPSRQAISDLIKQHSRGSSGGSVSLRGRSRASTPTSQPSQHRSATSVDSRSDAPSGVTPERSIVPQSRPATPVRPSTSGVEQLESTSKSIFQRGGDLLRRKGSKMGMNSDVDSSVGVTSPLRPATARAGLRSIDSSTSTSPIRDDSVRPSISKPYDFAHVMHGDISSFSGLSRIDESDLASQFDAIQARYRTTTELGEPLALQPEVVIPTPEITPVKATDTNETTSPALPSTPPRPAPPPKDSNPVLAPIRSDIRMSRSTENFSRPTPRSPTTPSAHSPLRPSSCHLQNLPMTNTVTETTESVGVKPLPLLPTVIHAVSTQDDTARHMIAAPLPTPPGNYDMVATRHHRQSSSKSSLRHMSTFPSARNPLVGGLVNDTPLLDIREEDNITRHRSDHELSQRAHRQSTARRVSGRRENLAVDEWEEAIDSAWDYEAEDNFLTEDETLRLSSLKPRLRESYLTIEQPVSENPSSPSTPLLTMAPSKRLFSQAANLVHNQESDECLEKDGHPLIGLGIETKPLTHDVSGVGAKRPNVPIRKQRSAYSAISNASSQESIILSIASSIMGTQRSSISSVSMTDNIHSARQDRMSGSNTAASPLLEVAAQRNIRPESGCLPPALLQQMNSEIRKASKPDSTQRASLSDSKDDVSSPKPNRPESICLSKEILATFPMPEKRSSGRAGEDSSISGKSDGEHVNGQSPAVTASARQSRVVSGSRVPASSRNSSISVIDDLPPNRQRSNTATNRTRPGRVSYSLFPTTASATQPIDVDGVAS